MTTNLLAVIPSPQEGNQRVAPNSFRMAPNFNMQRCAHPSWGCRFSLSDL